MESEILLAAREGSRERRALLHRVQAMTGRPMALTCRVLGISRACAYRTCAGRARRYATGEDRVVTAQISTIMRTRALYWARRVRALVSRGFGTVYNHQMHSASDGTQWLAAAAGRASALGASPSRQDPARRRE